MSSTNEDPNRANLTRARIAKLPPAHPGRRYFFYDEKVPHLAVRVTDSGSKAFYVNKRASIDGAKSKVLTRHIGAFPDMTVDDARLKAQEWILALEKGNDPLDSKRMAAAEMALDGLFREYMERHAQKSKKSWHEMERIYARHIADDLGTWRLSVIRHGDVEKMHARIAREKGEYAANRALQLLRAVFNKGKQWKLFVGENPAAGISLFQEKPRDRFMSPEEARRLWQVLSDEPDSDIKHFLMMLMLTGARKSNLLAMRWDEIDEKRMIWTIPETKNGDRLDIALMEAELSILRIKKAAQEKAAYIGPYVFPGEGKTGHLMEPKRQWTRIREKAGLQDIRLHDLRRSLAATMANANVNIALVKSVLGHKDIKTTIRVYAHTGKDAQRKARQLAHRTWLAGDEGGASEAVPLLIRPGTQSASKVDD